MSNKKQTQNSPSYLFGCGDENELSKLQQLSKIKDAKMACISSGERKKVFYLFERLPRFLEQQEEKILNILSSLAMKLSMNLQLLFGRSITLFMVS